MIPTLEENKRKKKIPDLPAKMLGTHDKHAEI